MGLIKAAFGAAGGVLADQWKEFSTAKPFLRMYWPSREKEGHGPLQQHQRG